MPFLFPQRGGDIMVMNAYLFILDMLMLPLFGILASHVGKKGLMFGASLLTAILTPILLTFLDLSSLMSFAVLRVFIVLCGVAFSASYHALALEVIPTEARYTLIALSASIGALIFGKPTAFISLGIYKLTNSVPAMATYFMLLSLGVTAVVGILIMGGRRKEERSAEPS